MNEKKPAPLICINYRLRSFKRALYYRKLFVSTLLIKEATNWLRGAARESHFMHMYVV